MVIGAGRDPALASSLDDLVGAERLVAVEQGLQHLPADRRQPLRALGAQRLGMGERIGRAAVVVVIGRREDRLGHGHILPAASRSRIVMHCKNDILQCNIIVPIRQSFTGEALRCSLASSPRSPARISRSTVARRRSERVRELNPRYWMRWARNLRRRASARCRTIGRIARSASTSRCKAAARTARSPGACSTTCWHDGRLEIEGMSGTSAGAVNAVMLADGLARGGPEEARKRLAEFWRAASRDGDLSPAQRAVADRLFSLMPIAARRSRLASTRCRATLALRSQSAQHQSAARI